MPSPGLLICLWSPKHLSLVAFDLFFLCQRILHFEPAAFPNDKVKVAYIICLGAMGRRRDTTGSKGGDYNMALDDAFYIYCQRR